jgi:hypothetical protein
MSEKLPHQPGFVIYTFNLQQVAKVRQSCSATDYYYYYYYYYATNTDKKLPPVFHSVCNADVSVS